jgi:hypothetical protein
MGGREVTVQKKSATALMQAGDNGEFEAILSTGTLDRDGEIVSPSDWQLPLPDSIPFNTNHQGDVESIIGSGRPFLDENGRLLVKGTFASNASAQHIRGLVREGHLGTVSVEFVPTKDKNILVGGSFVAIPSNPEARIIGAKHFNDQLSVILKAAGDGDAAMVQAIHDAAGHLGAACIVVPVEADDDSSMDGEDGSADGANKCAALKLRLKALSRC